MIDVFIKLCIVLFENILITSQELIFDTDEKKCHHSLHKSLIVYAEKTSKRVHLVAKRHGENETIVA